MGPTSASGLAPRARGASGSAPGHGGSAFGSDVRALCQASHAARSSSTKASRRVNAPRAAHSLMANRSK